MNTLKMVRIPGGTYTMGCSPNDNDCFPDECSRHTITISNFQISAYEITQAQWVAVMGNNPSRFSACAECPVERVTWYDVQDFIRELNRQTGKQYRLPTEAEWEYAARAGTTTKWYCGNDLNCLEDIAWYGDLIDNGLLWEYFPNIYQNLFKGGTHPVGQKEPNAWGLYDMSGNVNEWCQDWYGPAYYSESPPLDPPGPDSGTLRVKRGGSWYYVSALYCRSSVRDNAEPTYDGMTIGFRLAHD